MSMSHALRRPAIRKLLSRAAANATAVMAVSVIFGLKAYIDDQGRALAQAPAPASAEVIVAGAADASRAAN